MNESHHTGDPKKKVEQRGWGKRWTTSSLRHIKRNGEWTRIKVVVAIFVWCVQLWNGAACLFCAVRVGQTREGAQATSRWCKINAQHGNSLCLVHQPFDPWSRHKNPGEPRQKDARERVERGQASLLGTGHHSRSVSADGSPAGHPNAWMDKYTNDTLFVPTLEQVQEQGQGLGLETVTGSGIGPPHTLHNIHIRKNRPKLPVPHRPC